MKVPNPSGNGKDTAEAKGVHREVESEKGLGKLWFVTFVVKCRDKVAKQAKVRSLYGIVFIEFV